MIIDSRIGNIYSKGIQVFFSLTSNTRLIIYKGVFPVNISTWTESTFSADKLVEFNNWNLQTPISVDDNLLEFATSPSPAIVNATGTGTASYAMLSRDANIIASSTKIAVPVSLLAGTGVVILDTLTLTTGNPVEILDFAITFGN